MKGQGDDGGLSVVILAGGASSRMGFNKALADLGGRTMIETIVQQARSMAEDIIVVADDPEPYHFLEGVRFTGDSFPGGGPLAGVHGGLSAATAGRAFVVACDMPFFSPPLALRMAALLPSHDLVVPRLNSGLWEPMHAVYGKSCLGPMERFMNEQGGRQMFGFYPAIRVREVPEDEVRLFGDPGRLFFNINTPAELKICRNTPLE